MSEKPRIAMISTGGTIEKTYSELEGILHNEYSVLDVMLEMLEVKGIEIERIALMNKDSLHLTQNDLDLIVSRTIEMCHQYDGIVIVHGTDCLSVTGERILSEFVGEMIPIPIVLTGAMRPYMLRNTDAVQNLTEALMAIQLVEPGIYVAMHNQVLKFPGVIKDRELMTFRHQRKNEGERDDHT